MALEAAVDGELVNTERADERYQASPVLAAFEAGSQAAISHDANQKFDVPLLLAEAISCPFTWGLENAVETRNNLLQTKDDSFAVDMEDYFPEFVLIYHLLMAYEKTLKNDNLGALQSIMEAEGSLSNIKEKSTLKSVERVLDHIFLATKCYVLKEHSKDQGETSEVKRLLREICEVEDFRRIESAMLSGCKCLAWSMYYVTDNLEAINHAKKAIELERDNGKWYLLLGKNYRRLRRMHQSLRLRPNRDEVSAFVKAYRYSKNPLFGVWLAQAYRESREHQKAIEMYKEIDDLQPNSISVKLQLALGFIRLKEWTRAKSCLDYAHRRMPDSVVYHHYMGIYHETRNRNLEAALPHYERAAERYNYGAEWQYVKCKKLVDRDWDPLPYMLELMNKYAKDSDHVEQEINVQIGLYYLFDVKDVLPACPYLTKAIEIDPNGDVLKSQFALFDHPYRVDVREALKTEVRSALQNRAANYDEDTITMLENALRLCGNNPQV